MSARCTVEFLVDEQIRRFTRVARDVPRCFARSAPFPIRSLPGTGLARAGTNTRPDAVSSDALVDVKKVPHQMGPDGEPNTLFNSEQLRAQQDAAKASGREPVTVVSNNNPAAVRPSGPLAKNSTVLRHNPETGQFSEWNPLSNDGAGGWDPISNGAARSIVGGEPAPGVAAPP
jgi:hypothetical protein